MNWNAIDFDWNHARAFLATAEEGSLSAAARALKTTQPTIGRQVTALEEHLGLVLFERVGRGVELTPSGRQLATHIAAMRDAATAASLAASGQSQTIDGTVRITASDVMAAYHLPAFLEQFATVAPRLNIEIIASDDIQDLQRREADIALRHVRPDQPELIARLVCDASAHFYASQPYLDKHGDPDDASGITTQKIIGFSDVPRMVDYLNMIGVSLRPDQFHNQSTSGLVVWQMAQRGLGLCIMGDDVAQQTPNMRRTLKNVSVTYPIWLTTHRELHTSRRIRLVFDMLDQFLKPRMTS